MTYAILKTLVTHRATRNRCYFIRRRTPSYVFLEKPTKDGVEVLKVHISQVLFESPFDFTEELTEMNDRVTAAFNEAEKVKIATLTAVKAIVERT